MSWLVLRTTKKIHLEYTMNSFYTVFSLSCLASNLLLKSSPRFRCCSTIFRFRSRFFNSIVSSLLARFLINLKHKTKHCTVDICSKSCIIPKNFYSTNNESVKLFFLCVCAFFFLLLLLRRRAKSKIISRNFREY